MLFRSPARRFWKSARGDFGSENGLIWISFQTGDHSLTRLKDTCGTYRDSLLEDPSAGILKAPFSSVNPMAMPLLATIQGCRRSSGFPTAGNRCCSHPGAAGVDLVSDFEGLLLRKRTQHGIHRNAPGSGVPARRPIRGDSRGDCRRRASRISPLRSIPITMALRGHERRP